MPRTRRLNPGFFRNEVLGDLDPLARLMFAGLWTLADRDGRLVDRPRRIAADVLPYDQCDPEALISSLHQAGFITRYQGGGQNLIEINEWDKYQRPHDRESS